MMRVADRVYTCSTLLARYFESLGQCFVLKEPAILSQLSKLHYDGFHIQDPSLWDQLLTLAHCLLTRRWDGCSVVIVKPSDVVNPLAEDLHRKWPQTKAVFLATNIHSFVLSILKWDKRRRFVRRRLLTFRHLVQRGAGLNEEDVLALSDAQAAALLWRINVSICQDLISKGFQVHPLLGDFVASDSRGAMETVASTWHLSLETQAMEERLSDESAGLYSKDLSFPFGIEARREHLEGLNEMFGKQAIEAINWARDLRRRLGIELEWTDLPLIPVNPSPSGDSRVGPGLESI